MHLIEVLVPALRAVEVVHGFAGGGRGGAGGGQGQRAAARLCAGWADAADRWRARFLAGADRQRHRRERADQPCDVEAVQRAPAARCGADRGRCHRGGARHGRGIGEDGDAVDDGGGRHRARGRDVHADPRRPARSGALRSAAVAPRSHAWRVPCCRLHAPACNGAPVHRLQALRSTRRRRRTGPCRLRPASAPTPWDRDRDDAADPRTRAITTFLEHRALPVDPRHNSKIDRPALGEWAASELGVSA